MEHHSEEIIRLIQLHLAGGLTEAEQKALEDWCAGNPRHRAFLERLSHETTFADEWALYCSLDEKEAIRRFEKAIHGKRYLLRRAMRYAAAIVLPLGCAVGAYLFWVQREGVGEPAAYVRPQHAITLTLASGEEVALNGKASGEVLVTESVAIRLDSTQGLSYEAQGHAGEAEVRYNVLDVPVAADYRLHLSDGSVVYLNADSRLRYPETFTGGERKVYLEGEAYFEVAKDASRPFKVVAREVEVNVLGTHFNVNAYPEHADVVTTLAEGKVQVAGVASQAVLVPGEQAIASPEGMEVRKVDVQAYTSWKNGVFVFRSMPLEEIMEQVYRWYGVEAVFFNESVRTETFTGIINRSMSAEEFFRVIEKVVDVRFTMNKGNRVAITAK